MQGELAGRMATRVLQGETPSEIPLAGTETHRLMFDGRQLHRWGIREAALPAGSIVRYREKTLWERYGTYIVGILVVLVLQAVVIVALIVNRLQRRRAERELADRLRFESLLSDMSSRFVHVPNESVDEEVEQALGKIAEFLQLDAAALFRVSQAGTEVRASHSWMAGAGVHPVERIRLDEIPECWASLARGEAFHFARISELTDRANRERKLFQRIGMKSAVAVPLSVSGRNLGLAAFGCRHEERDWQYATLQRLTLIGEIFANALAHAQADETLRVSRTEARQLSGRLLTAQEDERRRLGRELHDDLSQRLAAAAIEAGNLEHRCAESSDARQGLQNLKDSLIKISDDVHQLSRQIHPAILDDLGLEDALRSECTRFRERYGYGAAFRCGDVPGDLPSNVAVCLYRIAQEALRNVAKHAMTDRVEVLLNADPEFVYLEVNDQGRGFDPDGRESEAGLGLASMEERVRLVGGELTVSSVPGKGTTISVRVALPEENA
jgi:signal transduction histidine kinase